jgi:1,4-dihydroxy-2-naphthoyl-CoA synthase
MKVRSAIMPAVVLAIAASILGALVTPISGTAIAGGPLLPIHCGSGVCSTNKVVTRKEADLSDGERHFGACWQYRHVGGRFKRTYVCD